MGLQRGEREVEDMAEEPTAACADLSARLQPRREGRSLEQREARDPRSVKKQKVCDWCVPP